MSSIVSDFLINPVARTVRRFSSPFASGAADPTADTETVPEHVRRRPPLPHDFNLDHGEVIADYDGPSLSFPSLSFMRGPDIALGARSPPLLIPHHRRLLQQTAGDETSQSSTARSPSPSLFEMDSPTIAIDGPPPASEITIMQDHAPHDHTSQNHTLQDEHLRAHAPQDQPLQDQSQQDHSRRLPANDGMMDMRRRILCIQSNDIFTPDQKRYLMQQVLTESYARARHARAVAEGKVDMFTPERAPVPGYASASQDPASSAAQDLGFGIAALETLRAWTGLEEELLPIHISEQDAKISYRVREQVRDCDRDYGEEEDEETEIITELGCQHYKRNVKVQCAACEKWYPCRLCHDEIEDHTLPRKLTKHMLCMLCSHPQKASDTCTKCGESAASYYCNICKLWSDDVDKRIYHCDECGICRVGHGLEKDFFHCKTCRACISIATREDHKCIERATDANCPICGDNMFDSPLSVIFMECGHPIHKSCFDQYMETSYKCPLCNKSIVKMDALFLNLANIIKEQPMPEEWQHMRSIVLCNDCSAKCSTHYHFLGLRCQNCQSFNTVELQRSPEPGQDPESDQARDQAAPPQAPQNPSQPGLDVAAHSDGEDEDEQLDFWGRDPSVVSSEDDAEGGEEEDDDDDDDDDDEEEDDEEDEDEESEDDENDEDIVIFGHR
ncbi:unnamed protein product [Discula destructiva]